MKIKNNVTIFTFIITGIAILLSACRRPDLPEKEIVLKEFYLEKAADLTEQMQKKPFQAFWCNRDTLCVIADSPIISTYGPYYENISSDKAILQCRYKYPTLTRTSWTILKMDIHYGDNMEGYEAVTEADIEFETTEQQATGQYGITICGDFSFTHKQDVEGQLNQCNKGAIDIMKLHPGMYYDCQIICKNMQPPVKTKDKKAVRFGYVKGKQAWVAISDKDKTDWKQFTYDASKLEDDFKLALEKKGLTEVEGPNVKMYASKDVVRKMNANKTQKYEIPFHFDLLKVMGTPSLKQSLDLKIAEYAIPKRAEERFRYLNELLAAVKRNPAAHRSIRERIRRGVDDTLYQRLKNVKTFDEKREIDEIIAILPWQIARLEKLSADRGQRLAETHANELKSCIRETRDMTQLKSLYPRIAVLERYPKLHRAVMTEFKNRESQFARPANTSRLAAMEQIVSLLSKFNPDDLADLDKLMEKCFPAEDYPEIRDAYGQYICLVSTTGKCDLAKDLCAKRNITLDKETETIAKSGDKGQLQSLIDSQHGVLMELLDFEMQRTRNALKK